MPDFKADYEAKYGPSVMLSSDDLTADRDNDGSKHSVIQYKSGKNSMCACLDCCKTYRHRSLNELPLSMRADRDACSDCGGRVISDNTVRIGKSGKAYYVVRPNKHNVYGNYDETGTATRLTSSYEGDLYIIYPSNKMHKSTCKLETTMDLLTGDVKYTAMNTEDPKNPSILTSFQIADSMESHYTVNDNPARISRIALYLDNQDKFTGSGEMPGVLSDRQIYSDDFVELGYIEVAKRYGLSPVFPSDENRFDHVNNFKCSFNAQKIIDICSRYPGVRDMVLDQLNENLKYKKEPHTPVEDARERTNLLLKTADDLKAIDPNIRKDLRRLRTKDQVSYYLQAITYGKDAMKDKPNTVANMKLRVDPNKSNHDGFGDKKKLRKRFNTSPLLTANTVYTAIKICPQFCKNIDYANTLFECIDKDTQFLSGQSFTGDYNDWMYTSSTPNLIENGTLMPITAKNELAFMKQYIRTHITKDGKGLGQVIQDWYGNSRDPEAYRREDGRPGQMPDMPKLFRDCAGMYERITSHGQKIAMTREDCLYYSAVDAKRKIDMLLADGKTQDDITELLSADSYWGKSAPACVGLICDDLAKNGPPDPSDFGWVGRNGKSMMQNRTIQEIHDEFINCVNSMGTDNIVNVPYEYEDAEIKRFNRDIDDMHFRLAVDTYDLVRTGQDMCICVGGSGYDRECQNKQALICVVENAAREKVGCVELSSDGNTLVQFKSPHNGSMQPPYMDTCKKWLDEANVRERDCDDYKHMGDPTYFPYGNGDFTQRRLAVANSYPNKNVIFDYYKQEALRQAADDKTHDIQQTAEPDIV